MMTMARLSACPQCGHHAFVQHCEESHTCDLVQCGRCHAYGTVDGKRWAVRPPNQRGAAA